MDVLACNNNVDERITSLLEKLVFRTAHKTINKHEVLGCMGKDMLDIPPFASLLAVLVESEHRRPTDVQTKIDARFEQFVETDARWK